MATLTELQARLEALRKARASGVRALEDNRGTRTEFKSDQEMASAIQDLRDQIAGLSDSGPASPVSLASFDAD